jgi:hypothetical protein
MLDFLVRDDATLALLLSEIKTIAVLGLSSDPERPSHGVAEYLKGAGYRIIPVNPKERTVLGEPAVPSLAALAGQKIDCVDVFRRPSDVLPHVAEAAALGVKLFWMQEGVVNAEAARQAHAAGMAVVMDRCMLVDHMRLRARGMR